MQSKVQASSLFIFSDIPYTTHLTSPVTARLELYHELDQFLPNLLLTCRANLNHISPRLSQRPLSLSFLGSPLTALCPPQWLFHAQQSGGILFIKKSRLYHSLAQNVPMTSLQLLNEIENLQEGLQDPTWSGLAYRLDLTSTHLPLTPFAVPSPMLCLRYGQFFPASRILYWLLPLPRMCPPRRYEGLDTSIVWVSVQMLPPRQSYLK